MKSLGKVQKLFCVPGETRELGKDESLDVSAPSSTNALVVLLEKIYRARYINAGTACHRD